MAGKVSPPTDLQAAVNVDSATNATTCKSKSGENREVYINKPAILTEGNTESIEQRGTKIRHPPISGARRAGRTRTSGVWAREGGAPLPRVYPDGISAGEFPEYQATINNIATALNAIPPNDDNSYRYAKIVEFKRHPANSQRRDKGG